MIFFANHPFAKRMLNVLDENGNEGCAVCGRPRDVHRAEESRVPGHCLYCCECPGCTGDRDRVVR